MTGLWGWGVSPKRLISFLYVVLFWLFAGGLCVCGWVCVFEVFFVVFFVGCLFLMSFFLIGGWIFCCCLC